MGKNGIRTNFPFFGFFPSSPSSSSSAPSSSSSLAADSWPRDGSERSWLVKILSHDGSDDDHDVGDDDHDEG